MSSINQLKRAVKAVKEANPVRKGDYVCVQTWHTPAVAFNAPASVSREPYEQWQLAVVVKATREGKADIVTYVGSTAKHELPNDRRARVWTLQGDDKQAAAKSLAATLTSETNVFSDGGILRDALRRHIVEVK